mmetsp:Transcript_35853/g.57596  ORF Transcript_35853/g.57596 Transcript_35853/m.57596 type:complete len:233 (+) Transcript_35853:7-705(+)
MAPLSRYSVKHQFGERSIEIFFIDTVILAGSSESEQGEISGVGLTGYDLPGPENGQLASMQIKWLIDGLRGSKADYILVGGHYPIYSIGSHGNTPLLEMMLNPFLKKYGAHYMCGHDHDMLHIDRGTGVQYILTGAGGDGCCYDAKHLKDIPKDAIKFAAVGKDGSAYQKMPLPLLGGFTSFQLTAESMKVIFHAHDGTELYRTQEIPRRKANDLQDLADDDLDSYFATFDL